jgi:hypothetical protein
LSLTSNRGVAEYWIVRSSRTMTSVILLLSALPGLAGAQTAPEKLQLVISKLRSCVRTYAPAAQAAGVRNGGDAINFFLKICITLPPGFADDGAALPGALSSSDLADVGAVPPGIFRRVAGEEWGNFVEQTRAR